MPLAHVLGSPRCRSSFAPDNYRERQRLPPFGPREPLVERVAFLATRFLQNPAKEFRNGQRGDEQILVTLSRHPCQRFRRLRFDDIADDVIEEVIVRPVPIVGETSKYFGGDFPGLE